MKWLKPPAPPTWLTYGRLRVMHLIVAAGCLGLAFSDGPSWGGMADCFGAGLNLAAAVYSGFQIRSRKAFDEMVAAFREMSDLNRALIENKVHILMEQHDDDPPLSPRLH